MQFNAQFSSRVLSCRAKLGLTQAELASQVGIVQRMIAAYEKGESKPRMNVLLKLSEIFSVTPEWLAGGGTGMGLPKNMLPTERHGGMGLTPSFMNPHKDLYKSIPVINSLSVSEWLDGSSHDDVKVQSHIQSKLSLSDLAFALLLDEPAMAYSDALGYGIPRNSIVLFEPRIYADDQDFVLALMPNGGVLFRQYFSGYRGGVLHALDSRYSPENLHDYEDEDGNTPMLIPAVSYEAYLPSADRLQDV
ncbi:helix-turn-helix domain-containing protein [Pectobacterium carotovorum]|uniref:helix-turn-helix domain-containing protein n=1 Tax=Pectobacterium carotovorum TaxID=554 RepID=UPI00382B0101